MKTSDFYFDLPQELIAQDPLKDRSASRLLVLDKETGRREHRVFKDIIEYLNPGDCLVVNNTKVIPARLYGSKVGTDAKIEILLLKRRENDIWETLVKPGKKAKPGTEISFGDGRLTGKVLEVAEEGNRLIQFAYEGIFEEILDELGCRCLRILRISWRIKTVIRLFTRSMTARLPLRQPDCILHRSFWKQFRQRV